MSGRVACAYASPGRWQPCATELKPPLVPAWSPPSAEDLVDAPILGGGLAFCVSRPHGLVAVDVRTGEHVWRLEAERAWGSCQLSGDRLLATPRPGRLAVLDPASGAERQSYAVHGILLQYGVVVDDRVVSPLDDSSLGAWDLAAGAFAWRVPTQWRPTLLAAGGGIVCVAEESAYVALDLATGSERWRFDVAVLGRYTTILWGERPGAATRHPIIAGDSVYVGVTGGLLVALDIASGMPRWTTQVGCPIPHNFALAPNGELLHLADDALVAIDAATGAVRARQLLNDAAGEAGDGPFAPMAVTERFVWAVDHRGRLAAIARADGHIAWRADLRGRVASPPVIADGRLLVVDLDGRLSVFREAV